MPAPPTRLITLAAVAAVTFVAAASVVMGRGRAEVETGPYAAAHAPCASDESPLERRIAVDIPEVFELANVVLTLTDFAERMPHVVWKNSSYHDAVLRHFGEHRTHPLVQQLDVELEGAEGWRAYYAFRETSLAWAFTGDTLQRTTPRRYWPQDLFASHVALVEDFAAVTGFREFFRDHSDFYAAEEQRLRQLVALDDMWEWLEARFPQRYAGYTVVFSPLINGSHSTRRFDADREMFMFVAGPGVVAELDAEAARARLGRIVFTEIDHNYVNPTTDLHLDEVNELFADLDQWYQDPANHYPTPYATFNEYMTWAVFSLYLRDRLDRPDVEIAEVERVMRRRGFVRFAEFNQALLRISADAQQACVPALYEPVLEWLRGGATAP